MWKKNWIKSLKFKIWNQQHLLSTIIQAFTDTSHLDRTTRFIYNSEEGRLNRHLIQRKVWYINILSHKRLGHYRRTLITHTPVIRITLRKRYWCWKLIEQTNEYCMIYNIVLFCSFLQQFEVVNLWTFLSPSNRKCSVAVTGVKRVKAHHNHLPQSVMCAPNSGRKHQGATTPQAQWPCTAWVKTDGISTTLDG